MICQSCGHDNPVANRFCGGCGAPLARTCPACGNSNPPDHRFCGKCGAVLGGSAPIAKQAETPRVRVSERVDPENVEGERKTVTALFADIKGSTELMEDLDPEEARAIIDPALKLMIDAAHRYDGYVVQSTGDGIFALFGAPVAHEDHPQRALYAALRMQEELKRYSAKVVAEGSSPIQGRVGINTGEVVVRSIQTGAGQVEYTPIGHTTNLASRMQTAAPVGSIAVSENTRKLCEGYFILKPLGATKVKGVSEPVNVYEVTGLGPLRTRLQRSAGRGLTKFVGREREMEAMRARRRAGELGPRTDCRGDGRGGDRQVAAVLRIQGDFSIGLDGAGDVFGLARQGVAPICRCSICCTAISKSRARTMNAPGARRSAGRIATGSRARRHAALSVRLARHRRGRRSAGADGRAD